MDIEKNGVEFGNNQNEENVSSIETSKDSQKNTTQEMDMLSHTENLDVFRGYTEFEAHNHKFKIFPVTLDEVGEFLNDKVLIPRKTDSEGNEVSDYELGACLIRVFFASDIHQTPFKVIENKRLIDKIKSLFKKPIPEIDYTQYTLAYPIVKWLERKVYYCNKPIKFKDLEKKFALTKAEIARMLIALNDFSGF